MARKFDPPPYLQQADSLNERVKEFMAYWRLFFAYLQEWINDNLRGDVSPFTLIASASTIAPARSVQPVTGAVTVSTISAAPEVLAVTLLAIDGFATNTAGNIAAVVTLAAGTGRTFHKNPVTGDWYPS